MAENIPQSIHKSQRKERLNADDTRFRELVERTRSSQTRYVWGLHETRVLKTLEENIAANRIPNPPELQDSIKHFLEDSKYRLAEFAKDKNNPFASLGIDIMLGEAIDDEVVYGELRKIFPDAVVEWNGKRIASALPIIERVEDLPNNLYRRILELHAVKHEQKDQGFQEEIPAMQERFVRLIKKSGLPISYEDAQKRIAQVRVIVGDSIGYSVSSEILGEFDPEHDLAVISLEEISILADAPEEMKSQDERRFQTYTHEMLHALSSRSVLGDVQEDDGALESVRVQRLGLSMEGRFRWLNEAMTERMTLELLGESDGSYPKERSLLSVLLEQGLSYACLREAYFERHEPPTSGLGLKHWREMMNSFNQTFKQGFLVKLDNYVRDMGLDKAIKQVGSNWRKI